MKGTIVAQVRYTNLVATTFEPQRVSYPPHTQYVNDEQLLGVALPFKIEPGIIAAVTLRSRGHTITVPVVDVGPWNTKDDYWRRRAPPRVLAQYAAKTQADNGRIPTNPAAIDLTWHTALALGMKKEDKRVLEEIIISEYIPYVAEVT